MTEFSSQLKSWSAKVSRGKIRRLYLADARGIHDEDLIDDVGTALFARCADVLEVTRARDGEVTCQGCGKTITRHGPVEETLKCSHCGWQVMWRDYKKSYTRKGLLAGRKGAAVVKVFRDFVAQWPRCQSPAEKMILIDTLLHEFHKGIAGVDTRPAACNVIRGSAREVIDLLDDLAGVCCDRGSSRSGQARWRGRLGKTRFAIEGREHKGTPFT